MCGGTRQKQHEPVKWVARLAKWLCKACRADKLAGGLAVTDIAAAQTSTVYDDDIQLHGGLF
jgi:hypothetical protein